MGATANSRSRGPVSAVRATGTAPNAGRAGSLGPIGREFMAGTRGQGAPMATGTVRNQRALLLRPGGNKAATGRGERNGANRNCGPWLLCSLLRPRAKPPREKGTTRKQTGEMRALRNVPWLIRPQRHLDTAADSKPEPRHGAAAAA